MRFEPNEDQAALFSGLDRMLDQDAARWAPRADGERHDWSDALDGLLEANGVFDAAAEPSLGPVAGAEIARRLAALPVLVEGAASSLLRPRFAPDLPRPFAVIAGAEDAATAFLPKARTVLRIGPDGLLAAAISPDDVAPSGGLYAYPIGRLARAPNWSPVEGDPAEALALWRAGLAAEIAGVLQGGLDAVVEHVSERRQFGRPLGAFQGVQHRLAGLSAKVEGLRWSALRAAQGLDPAHAAEALGRGQQLCTPAVYDLHQFMGAMGLTLEHPLHRWTVRARWLRTMLGGADANLAEAARLRWLAA